MIKHTSGGAKIKACYITQFLFGIFNIILFFGCGVFHGLSLYIEIRPADPWTGLSERVKGISVWVLRLLFFVI